MSDEPKKPRARKPRPRRSAEDGSAEAPQRMDDAAASEAVLAAALPHAAFDGFTDSVLQKAGDGSRRDKAELARLFANGPLSLVEFYSHLGRCRDGSEAGGDGPEGHEDPRAHRRRGEGAAGGAGAAQGSGAPRRRPAVAAHACRRWAPSWCIARWMRCGAPPATPPPISISTPSAASWPASMARPPMRWFNDTSEDEKATDEFLAARIENVMQFEKFKAKAKEALCELPGLRELGQNQNPNSPWAGLSRPSRVARHRACDPGWPAQGRP